MIMKLNFMLVNYALLSFVLLLLTEPCYTANYPLWDFYLLSMYLHTYIHWPAWLMVSSVINTNLECFTSSQWRWFWQLPLEDPLRCRMGKEENYTKQQNFSSQPIVRRQTQTWRWCCRCLVGVQIRNIVTLY